MWAGHKGPLCSLSRACGIVLQKWYGCRGSSGIAVFASPFYITKIMMPAIIRGNSPV
jgi:hypothetical protein